MFSVKLSTEKYGKQVLNPAGITQGGPIIIVVIFTAGVKVIVIELQLLDGVYTVDPNTAQPVPAATGQSIVLAGRLAQLIFP